MGTTEGTHKATEIVPMTVASAHLVSSAPDPEVPEKSFGTDSPPNTSFAFSIKPMPLQNRDKLAPCRAVKDCTIYGPSSAEVFK